MARSIKKLTNSWQQVGTGKAVFSIASGVGHTLIINETATDDAASFIATTAATQIVQTEAKTTFAKGKGIVLIVDAE